MSAQPRELSRRRKEISKSRTSGEVADQTQQALALRRIEIKLRRAHALQFFLRRISEHAHDGVVAVEDSPVDGGVQDSGQISLINEVAQLVGRFERELAFLAIRDVAEDDDRAANISGRVRATAARRIRSRKGLPGARVERRYSARSTVSPARARATGSCSGARRF